MDSIDTETTRFAGPVTRPGEDRYLDDLAGFQTAYRHRPELIVGATGRADVAAALRLAAARDWPVAVQSTGHGLGAALDGGLLIDTRRMAGVRVDPVARTAWVQAGTRWTQVIHAAAVHGLAPLSGSSPEVGVVGYTLGGGLGVLAREFGYAADQVHRVELVTADGTVRQVDADAEPDLFWAVRGGGGGFGVVTAMEIGLVPVRCLYGGGLYFDTPAVPELLTAYRQWTEDLPEQLTSSVGLIPYPDRPMVPEPLRGRYAAHVRIAYTGAAEEGERLIAPLRAVAPRLIDAVGRLPYTESHTIYRDPSTPHGYYGTNAMIDSLEPSELLGPARSCVVQINHLGGALARPPRQPNAVSHRNARYLVRALAVVTGLGPGSGREAPERVVEALAHRTLGRSPNFLFGEAGTTEQVRRCYDRGTLRRLTGLKARYDPSGRLPANLGLPG